MRHLRIFLLHLQYAFELRSRSFVWFLISFINASIYLLFWQGALRTGNVIVEGLSLSGITSYYLLLIIAGAFLTVHIDEDIALGDIKQGHLVKYLTRPFSYFWIKFIEEIPWRIIQGLFGVFVLVGYITIFHIQVNLIGQAQGIFFAVVIVVLAYMISFVFSMIVGLSALWVVEYSGLQQLVTVITLVLAGYVIPIEFLPSLIGLVARALPFAYMAYFPVIAIQGAMDSGAMIHTIGIQAVWLFVFLILYSQVWRRGIKRFTGVGQ